MSKVTYASEHAGCVHGSTCLIRGATKNPASLEEIRQVMRIVNTETGLKAYHDCRWCIREITGMHTCSFAGCSHETDQKSNLTIHENTKHVGFRTHCETDGCRFTWSDYSAYSKHKERTHGLQPVRRNEPGESGCASGKRRSQKTRLQNKQPQNKRSRKERAAVRRIVAREDSALSAARPYYSTDSPVWSEMDAFNLPPFPPESDVSRPSSDFAYPPTALRSSQLHTAETMNQHTSPSSSASAAPHYNPADLANSSNSASAVDTSLAHWPLTDSIQNVYAQNVARSLLPYGNGSSDLPCYSTPTLPLLCDSSLDSSEYSGVSNSLYGFGVNWHALDGLLAAPLSGMSFDPTVETTIQLGHLGNPCDLNYASYSSLSLPTS